MEGLEGLGEGVTGGLAARAVEPEAGERQESDSGHRACLNCGTEVRANFCPECGQAAHVHRSLGAFWHDVAHSVLHFEGKIWRTLPLLAWQPGELTRRYVEGERARFVSPMALFLFSVFLMFAVFSALGGPVSSPAEAGAEGAAEARREIESEFQKERSESVAKIEGLRRERAGIAASGQPTTEIDIDIRNAERGLALEERLYRQALALADADSKREAEQARIEAEQAEPGPARQATQEADEEKLVVIGGADRLNDWFNAAFQKAKKNPSLLIYKIQANAYKFSWALIPISVPFVWVLFLHRRRYRQYKLYDHMVFVTYSIAFMSLGVIVLTLLRQIGLNEAVAVIAMILIPPLHMYRQLRGAYLLPRWSAAWRTVALIAFAGVAVSIFFTLLIALGVLG